MFQGVYGGRRVRLATSPPSVCRLLESWRLAIVHASSAAYSDRFTIQKHSKLWDRKTTSTAHCWEPLSSYCSEAHCEVALPQRRILGIMWDVMPCSLVGRQYFEGRLLPPFRLLPICRIVWALFSLLAFGRNNAVVKKLSSSLWIDMWLTSPPKCHVSLEAYTELWIAFVIFISGLPNMHTNSNQISEGFVHSFKGY